MMYVRASGFKMERLHICKHTWKYKKQTAACYSCDSLNGVEQYFTSVLSRGALYGSPIFFSCLLYDHLDRTFAKAFLDFGTALSSNLTLVKHKKYF